MRKDLTGHTGPNGHLHMPIIKLEKKHCEIPKKDTKALTTLNKDVYIIRYFGKNFRNSHSTCEV